MTRNICLVVASVLAMFAATADAASQKSASRAAAVPAPTAEQIQELDEIKVHGKRLVDRINEAEDKFFPLYNKINKKNDFDVTCAYARFNPESMIMSRMCLPGFLGKSWGAPPVITGQCYSALNGLGYGYDIYVGRYTSAIGNTGPCIDGGYEPPSLEFIMFAKSGELRQQMTKVISNDPQLLAMAAHLGDLYMEFDAMKNRFRKIKGLDEKGVRRPLKPVKASLGPRSI